MKKNRWVFLFSFFMISVTVVSNHAVGFQDHWTATGSYSPQFNVGGFTNGYTIVDILNNGPNIINGASNVYGDSYPGCYFMGTGNGCSIKIWTSRFGGASYLPTYIYSVGGQSSGTINIEHYATETKGRG